MQPSTQLFMTLSVVAALFQSAQASDLQCVNPKIDIQADVIADMLVVSKSSDLGLGAFDPHVRIAQDVAMTGLPALPKIVKKTSGKSAFKKYWDWRADRHRRMVRLRPTLILPMGNGFMTF
jgi:hypothetical protein